MDKESLSQLTVVKLKELAKANGLSGYSALRKDALVELIAASAPAPRGAKQARASPTPEYSSFIDDCVRSPRKDVQQFADELEIDVDNKTQRELCAEIEQILEPKSPPSFVEQCAREPRKTLKKVADALQVEVEKRTKEQICGEIEQRLEPLSHADCMKKKKPELVALAKQAKIPGAASKTKDFLCNALATKPRTPSPVRPKIRRSKPRTPSPARMPSSLPTNITDCMKKKRPELIELAKHAGISGAASKTKAVLCDALVAISQSRERAPSRERRSISRERAPSRERRSISRERVPSSASRERTRQQSLARQLSESSASGEEVGLSASFSSDDWLSVANRLTGTHNAYMTPNLLARQAPRPKLEREALNRGILNVKEKTRLQLAQEIYADTQKLSYAGAGSARVENAISATISDPFVAQELIDETIESLDLAQVDESIESVVATTSLNRDEAAQLVVDQLELAAAIPIIKAAEIDQTISTEEARDALSELRGALQEPRIVPPAPRAVKSPSTIEARLRELREPEAKVSELALVQTRVFQLLGLLH